MGAGAMGVRSRVERSRTPSLTVSPAHPLAQYISMGTASYLVYRQGGEQANRALALYVRAVDAVSLTPYRRARISSLTLLGTPHSTPPLTRPIGPLSSSA